MGACVLNGFGAGPAEVCHNPREHAAWLIVELTIYPRLLNPRLPQILYSSMIVARITLCISQRTLVQ